MAEELNVGCARPTGGPVGETPLEQSLGKWVLLCFYPGDFDDA